jgi:very-short-patch-repair endonuclease
VGEGGERSESGEGSCLSAHIIGLPKSAFVLTRNMRRAATDAEAALWHLLRDRRFSEVKFRRQVPFQNYILDFVCFERRLIIEIDGSQHLDSKRDERRDAVLASEGFQIIRYWNNDVLQRRNAVLEDLFAKLGLDQG